jgi:hypothetical protein
MPDSSGNPSENTPTSDSTEPYTITEQDGKLNVVFTSGPLQGQHFQIDRPQHVDTRQPVQLEDEPPYPYSYLDGHGNEISKEECERVSALEIAEEARLERESREAREGRGT